MSGPAIDSVIPQRFAAFFGPGAVYFERHVFLFFFLGFAAVFRWRFHLAR